MNYFEWSQQYYDTAKDIDNTILKLKKQRCKACLTEKKELDLKIAKYRTIFYECMQTARLLELRHKGVM